MFESTFEMPLHGTAPDGSLAVLAAYYGVLAVLAGFGCHRLALIGWWWRYGRRPLEAPSPPADWPTVLVQLPIYNELFVAARLVRAVCALDYPRDRLSVQVLDDSTDTTSELLAHEVALGRQRGIDIEHLRRPHRSGYKAGALRAGLVRSRAELVAVFDADFVPAPDFLRRVVPSFGHGGGVRTAMVQTRWGYSNRNHSLLTALQAMLLDGHFLVEQPARAGSGRWFNFNGTAGVLRRRAIDEAGGWHHDTLTEDLDLSYRSQLAGARFVYQGEVVVPSELPADIHALKTQQQRWAKGTAQTLRKLLPALWRSRAPVRQRLEAAIHLSACSCYPLTVVLSLLVLPAAWLVHERFAAGMLAADLPLLALATGAVSGYYLLAARLAGQRWGPACARLPALLALGIGLAPNNSVAVLSGLFRWGGEFERTPKQPAPSERAALRGVAARRYAARSSRVVWLEIALALYSTFGIALAVRFALWWALPFLALFLGGYLLVAWLSLHTAPAERRNRGDVHTREPSTARAPSRSGAE